MQRQAKSVQLVRHTMSFADNLALRPPLQRRITNNVKKTPCMQGGYADAALGCMQEGRRASPSA
jgi:hypothetical protein